MFVQKIKEYEDLILILIVITYLWFYELRNSTKFNFYESFVSKYEIYESTNMRMCKYTNMQMLVYVNVWMCDCANMLIWDYVNVWVCECASLWMFSYTKLRYYEYSNMLMSESAYVQM